MKKKDHITMADIAKAAGVSRATVSRALQNSDLINQETREKIQRIAREHHYSVNVAARNFRLKKTHILAVVLLVDKEWGHEISNAFLMALLGCIADEASDAGYDLLLATNLSAIDDLHTYYIEGKRADGIIVIGQGRNDPRIQKLAEKNSPFIVWGAPVRDCPYPVVGSDNETGAYQGTQLLIERGRRSIAFLGDTRHPEVAARFAGFSKALKDNDLVCPDDLIIPTDFSRSDGYSKAQEKLLDSGQPFDGIFAVSDSIAIGAMKALEERGIAIPLDVGLVGFDDSPISQYSNPGLTTIKQDISKGGKHLVRGLISLIEGGEPQTVQIPTQLIVRRSC